MASKASIIQVVDLDSYRVTYLPHGATRSRTDRWSFLSKLDKVGALKFCGYRFNGSPMHYSLDDLATAWGSLCMDSTVRVFGTVPSEPTVAPTVAPSIPSTPKAVATPSVSSSGSIDDVLRTVVEATVREALKGWTPNASSANADEVAQLRKDLEVVAGSFGTLAVAIEELTSKVNSMRPKVTNVTVNGTTMKPIEGTLHREFKNVLALLAKGQNVYLVGPAGSGKSTIPEQCARALGRRFAAQSCGQTDSKFDYVGYRDAGGVLHGTLFRDMWENGGLFLLDELDNASPDMLVTLNQALANGQMAFPDAMVKKHPEFLCVGAGNTFGSGATAQYVGRSPQDMAFMDRFTKWVVDIDESVEDAMVNAVDMPNDVRTKWVNVARACRANAERHGLRVMVTPRAVFRGAQMLSDGEFTIDQAVMSQFGFGLDKNQLAKVLEGVTL